MNLNERKSFCIESLGCISNKVDAARVETFFKSNGWLQTHSCEDAALIILMTCAFSQASEDYNMNRLHQLQQIKGPESQIVVGGCLPSINDARLRESFKGFVFSPRTLHTLNEFISTRVKIENISPGGVVPEDSTIRAIRVSTGCMGHCTYCAIPFANGRTNSRSIEDIQKDLQESVEQGFRKVKLVSEDLGAYGQDNNTSIVHLLETIATSNIDIELYLDNLNPKWLYRYKRELFELFHSDKIVRRFSIPIQSGSDRILRLMKRGNTVSQVREILRVFYDSFSDVKVSTDFIVGFPSETHADFEKTRLILNEFPFHFLEIFTYEDRPGTRASNLTPKVPDAVKEERRQILFKDFLKQFLESNSVRNLKELRHLMQTCKKLPVHFNLSVEQANAGV